MRKTEKAVSTDSTIGKNILWLRLAKGWSRMELAAKIDVSHQQLLKYERATNRISAGRLQLIADTFDVHPGSLFVANNNKDARRVRIAIELVRGFNLLSPKKQDAVVKLVRAMR